MDSEIVSILRRRYTRLPPLVVSRSIERAKDETELFDILDTVPSKFPIRWDVSERRWVTTVILAEPKCPE